jgi:hypothetical protein
MKQRDVFLRSEGDEWLERNSPQDRSPVAAAKARGLVAQQGTAEGLDFDGAAFDNVIFGMGDTAHWSASL